MKRGTLIILMFLVAMAGIIAVRAGTDDALAAKSPPIMVMGSECRFCHATYYSNWSNSMHGGIVDCVTCHEGTALHITNPTVSKPKVHFDSELCGTCHRDQYNSFLTDNRGKTKYGGGVEPVSLWSKTRDLPYRNNGSGSYYWFIPSNLALGNYRVRIVSSTNTAVTDTSDVDFSIVP